MKTIVRDSDYVGYLLRPFQYMANSEEFMYFCIIVSILAFIPECFFILDIPSDAPPHVITVYVVIAFQVFALVMLHLAGALPSVLKFPPFLWKKIKHGCGELKNPIGRLVVMKYDPENPVGAIVGMGYDNRNIFVYRILIGDEVSTYHREDFEFYNKEKHEKETIGTIKS